MSLPAVTQASTILLAQLVSPAARALILALIVGVGLKMFRVKNTSLRLFSWIAVLYAALAMPLLQQMLPPFPVPSPAFLDRGLKNVREAFVGAPEKAPALRVGESRRNPAYSASSAAGMVTGTPQRGERLAHATSSLSPAIDARPMNQTHTTSPASIPWSVVAAGIYLAIALIFFARFLAGLVYSRRLVQGSQSIDAARVTQRLAACGSVWRLPSIPRAAESELISVPLTVGALRPTILLPPAWRAWDDAQLHAVIAHEVSHVARRDTLTQFLSLLHRAIFWFSPLSWWLDRRLADLAEQASDEAALSSGVERKHYARILLGFFETVHAVPGRVRWQGVSMAKLGQAEPGQAELSQAEERIERILAWKGSVAMRLQKTIAVAIVAFAVPVVYLAASAHPSHHEGPQPTQIAQNQTPQTPPSASSPVTAPTTVTTPPPEAGPASGVATGVTDGTIDAPVSSGPAAPASPRLAPVAPVGPSAPVAAIAPIAPVVMIDQSESANTSSRRGFSYHYGFDDEQRFVIVSGKTDSLTMSGSTEDARHVEKLRKTIPGDFIWFERDEKSYVIRDQATIDRAKKLWEPQEELGKKQEALGKQQEALGKQQEALGAKMQQIRVNVPDMNADLEKLKAELKQLSSGASVEQIGHIQSEIGDLQSKIGDIQSHAGDQQGKLGEEMGALGEQQGKLGEEQGKLGEQQGKLAEQASHQMKQLLDEAITKGTAQPEI
jgi:beta-lactamase regulating signal transducer with metallopeptidase domain